MSYAYVPKRGYAGYDDLVPSPTAAAKAYQQQLKAQAQATGQQMLDASKAQAIAFAEQQLNNYPSAAQVLLQFNEYKAYFDAIPGFNLDDLRDPKKCIALMKSALIAYAKANGYPTTTKEAEDQLAAYAASVAASELGITIPPTWPSNLKDLKSVAVDLACTAVVMETGIDPRSMTVVVDALMDGKLSESECEAIGTTAGAIAGAIVGQAFGVPAPIGAFIGGLAGGYVGGTIGQIFGATNHPTTAELLSQFRAAEQAMRDQANAACSSARAIYWQIFDQLILATELQWEVAEVNQVGWRFGLRWYGTETYTPLGGAFSLSWDPATRTFSGPVTTANRAIPVSHQNWEIYPAGATQPIRTTVYNYGCPFSFGCPYPPLPPGIDAGGYDRTVAAFLARGALWIPPAQRQTECSLPLDDSYDLYAYRVALQVAVNQEQQAVQALRILSVTVIGDLVKTAASVAAEKAVHDTLRLSVADLNAAQIARGAALSQAQKTGQNLSDLLNYGVLALGVGLLGSALWKRRKR